MSLFGSIKSIQRGTIALTGTVTADAAGLTAVDVTKSTLTMNGQEAASDDVRSLVRISLVDATTVRATKSTAALNSTVSFELVERY